MREVPRSRVAAQAGHSSEVAYAEVSDHTDIVRVVLSGLVNLDKFERHHLPDGWYVANVTEDVWTDRPCLQVFEG